MKWPILLACAALIGSPLAACTYAPDTQSASEETEEALEEELGAETAVSADLPAFTQGSAANTIDQDGTYEDETYESEKEDENALRVTAASVTLNRDTVKKLAGESTVPEAGLYYGLNAALLVNDGSTTLSETTIQSSVEGAPGAFAYGGSSSLTLENSTVDTDLNYAPGVSAANEASLSAKSLTLRTSGDLSAGVLVREGSKVFNIEESEVDTNGYNSPALEMAADVIAHNTRFTATSSEALLLKGSHNFNFDGCSVAGNMDTAKNAAGAINTHTVMIYDTTKLTPPADTDGNDTTSQADGDTAEATPATDQADGADGVNADGGSDSQETDASEAKERSKASFAMNGGSLIGNRGDLFYITNCDVTMGLNNVNLQNADANAYLFYVSGNSGALEWGTPGYNGANLDLTAINQKLTGIIAVDTISTMTLNLTEQSVFTGTATIKRNGEGGKAVEDNLVVNLGAGCTWELTANATVSKLTGDGTVKYNGFTITLADGTVMKEDAKTDAPTGDATS